MIGIDAPITNNLYSGWISINLCIYLENGYILMNANVSESVSVEQ